MLQEQLFEPAPPSLEAPADVSRLWIRRRLNELGKTQNELAAALDRKPAAVSRLIHGNRPISEAEIRKIARVLDVTPATLLARIAGEDEDDRRQVAFAGFIGPRLRVFHERGEAIGAGEDPAPWIREAEPPTGFEGAEAYLVLVDNPKFDPGEIVFAWPGKPDALIDCECIVTRGDGTRAVRWIRPGSRPGRFNLVSRAGDVEPDATLLRAAAIAWVARAGKAPIA
jgi:transcriptional regulator with XRE-family HTH domain